MYDRYYNKGTYNFEKRYNPNEQKFDLEKIRKNNIIKINDIIKESQNVIDKYSKLKTEVVRDYSKTPSYSMYMDDELENLEEQKEIELREIKNRINPNCQVIIHIEPYHKKENVL